MDTREPADIPQLHLSHHTTLQWQKRGPDPAGPVPLMSILPAERHVTVRNKPINEYSTLLIQSFPFL